MEIFYQIFSLFRDIDLSRNTSLRGLLHFLGHKFTNIRRLGTERVMSSSFTIYTLTSSPQDMHLEGTPQGFDSLFKSVSEEGHAMIRRLFLRDAFPRHKLLNSRVKHCYTIDYNDYTNLVTSFIIIEKNIWSESTTNMTRHECMIRGYQVFPILPRLHYSLARKTWKLLK